MSKNICPECATENEEQYIYCKNCGAPLKAEPQKSAEPVFQGNPDPQQNPYQLNESPYSHNGGYNNGYYNQSTSGAGYINGIPEIEYKLFIGKNSEKFIPKFAKMEFTNSKTSWCWPPAILGFFFGPLGAALWFFYRKMTKQAWILTAIGAVLSVITGILDMGTTDAYVDALLNSWSSGDYNSLINALGDTTQTVPMIFSGLINNISTLAACIFSGLFAVNCYRNYVYGKITEYKTMQANPTHYRLGLTYIGGTSGGMLALGIVLMLGVDYVVSFATTLISALI